MKYLITGAAGFVARFMIEKIFEAEPCAQIIGLDRSIKSNLYKPNGSITYIAVDLLNRSEIKNILSSYCPDYIIHLASFSSVAYSWENPVESFTNNVNISLNILEAVRLARISPKILSVGSSEQYGKVSSVNIPISEETALNPTSPYAISRVSQEQMSLVYCRNYGLNVICTRSFNHIGPFQTDRFVVPSIAKQLVKISHNNEIDNKISIGNPRIIRDFTDVRDIVNGYYLLLKGGLMGEVYNLCSSRGLSLQDTVVMLSEIVGIDVEVSINTNLIRPVDNEVIIGSFKKIYNHVGWKPDIKIEKSLNDIVSYWKQTLNSLDSL